MALFNQNGILVKSPRCVDPPKYGLLSVVPPFTPTDHYFAIAGINWEDSLCSDGTQTFIDVCPPVSGFTLPSERNLDFCSAQPFLAVGSFDCSTIGRPANEAFEIARTRLLVWENRQVEKTLWTGITANGNINPSFAFGNSACGILPVDISPTGALDPVTAMALLEERLGDEIACGGLIHIPYGLIAFFIKHHLLINTGGDEYYSPTGFRVVAGHGYPGSGPNNVAAASGETWIVGTGPMLVARGPVIMVPDEVKEGVNRNINSITVRAERFYAVGFSCSLLFSRVKLSCGCCG